MPIGQSEITGPIVLEDSHGRIDARRGVWAAKGQEGVQIVEHWARCILLVEKGSIFNRLVEHNFAAKNRCILASDGGYPGRSLRKLLHHIEDETKLPFYVLADNDPAGYEFFFVIARGGLGKNPRERALAIPRAAYLGLRCSDFESMKLPHVVTIGLKQEERQQLDRLLSYPWLLADSPWRVEMNAMLTRGFKVEMEAAICLSVDYLAEHLLPQRLAVGDHLRLA